MLALGNGYLQHLHLVRVVVTLSSHGTETELRPWDISCGSLVIPELIVNIIDCDIFHTSQRAAVTSTKNNKHPCLSIRWHEVHPRAVRKAKSRIPCGADVAPT